jgi:ferrous iron transport protein A
MTSLALLHDLPIGTAAIIAAIDRAGIDPETTHRLHELGFDEGVDVELLHRAPFGGDPLAVRIGNMVVALRLSMARLIEVEPALASTR